MAHVSDRVSYRIAYQMNDLILLVKYPIFGSVWADNFLLSSKRFGQIQNMTLCHLNITKFYMHTL